jgi:hypothetical protein
MHIDMTMSANQRNNRCPGELKLSMKWGSEMLLTDGEAGTAANISVLSQIHYYMNVHGARTGFVLTDKEMFALKRDGQKWGDVKISEPIPYCPKHAESLNVKIALWFLLSRYGSHEIDWSHKKFAVPRMIRRTLSDIIGSPTETEIEDSLSDTSYHDLQPNSRPYAFSSSYGHSVTKARRLSTIPGSERVLRPRGNLLLRGNRKGI